MAQILLSRRPNIGSGVIRAVSWSAYSHAEIVDGSILWGASFPHGVDAVTLDHRLSAASKAVLITIPTPDDVAVIQFAKSQRGKPYDTLGVVGLGLHRDWQDPSSWWCSEYVAACIAAGKLPLFRDGVMNRITPQHLYMLNYPILVLK